MISKSHDFGWCVVKD